MQYCHGLLRLIDRDKQVVMVNARDYVAADSRLPQCGGERSSQTHRRKIRVDGDGDPGSDERNRQSQINRILSDNDINISAQYLQTREDVGYVVIDMDARSSDLALEKLAQVPGTLRTRVLF